MMLVGMLLVALVTLNLRCSAAPVVGGLQQSPLGGGLVSGGEGEVAQTREEKAEAKSEARAKAVPVKEAKEKHSVAN